VQGRATLQSGKGVRIARSSYYEGKGEKQVHRRKGTKVEKVHQWEKEEFPVLVHKTKDGSHSPLERGINTNVGWKGKALLRGRKRKKLTLGDAFCTV